MYSTSLKTAINAVEMVGRRVSGDGGGAFSILNAEAQSTYNNPKMKRHCVSAAGRTALHWASAVNNADAVMTLLKHNANRDAQDNKVRNCCRHVIS